MATFEAHWALLAKFLMNTVECSFYCRLEISIILKAEMYYLKQKVIAGVRSVTLDRLTINQIYFVKKRQLNVNFASQVAIIM